MSDQVKPPKPMFSLAFWILLILVAVVGLSLLPGAIGHAKYICKVRTIDVETASIQAAIQSYKAEYGALPLGDSSAVFRQLCGQNPRQHVFFQSRSSSISADGGILDPWGTPYKVYFSGNEIIVRSAGPNRQFDGSSEKDFDDYIR